MKLEGNYGLGNIVEKINTCKISDIMNICMKQVALHATEKEEQMSSRYTPELQKKRQIGKEQLSIR